MSRFQSDTQEPRIVKNNNNPPLWSRLEMASRIIKCTLFYHLLHFPNHFSLLKPCPNSMTFLLVRILWILWKHDWKRCQFARVIFFDLHLLSHIYGLGISSAYSLYWYEENVLKPVVIKESPPICIRRTCYAFMQPPRLEASENILVTLTDFRTLCV